MNDDNLQKIPAEAEVLRSKKKSNLDQKKLFPETTLEEVAEVLSLTIKYDDENKLITFLCMLSAYTHDSQINVSFNAPSSSGKTYMTREVAKLFPDVDKIELSGASPTSFYHGEGILDEKRKAKIVPLSRKILIFYEQPNPELQKRLRSVMSHDNWEAQYRITNKSSGSNKAELIILEGFPATIFCSAGLRLDEQEATRAILLSPQVTDAKIQQGVHLQSLRGSNSSDFDRKLNQEPNRLALMDRIVAIKREEVDSIIIPDPGVLEDRFRDVITRYKPRHMRDLDHLQKLIKVTALLNVWHRRQSDGTVVASEGDIDQAFALWTPLCESQELNVPPMLLNFYKEYIVAAYNEKRTNPEFEIPMSEGYIGLSSEDLSRYYYRQEEASLNNENLRKQILPQLEGCGLIVLKQPPEGDRRSRHIFPQLLTDETI